MAKTNIAVTIIKQSNVKALVTVPTVYMPSVLVNGILVSENHDLGVII